MDPLSIIASTIAIATPITIGLRKIRDSHAARLELTLLVDEVDELILLLAHLSDVLKQQNSVHQLRHDTRMLQAILAARNKLDDLSQDMTEWIPGRTPKAFSRAWIQIGPKVKSFKDGIGRIRSQLLTILSIMNLYGATRVEMKVRDAVQLARNLALSQSLAQADLKDMMQRHDRFETMLNGLDRGAPQSRPDISAVNRPPGDGFPSQSIDKTHHAVKAFHHNGSILFESSQMTAVAAVGIRNTQFPRSSCKPWCVCVCHDEFRFRSPQCLDRIIGGLYVGASGLSFFQPPCNEKSCHLRTQPMVYASYLFPKWLLSRMVSCIFAVTPLAGPVASLKVQRTVPGNADVFTLSKLGDLDGIKKLFETGLASPHDVSITSGITPLHMAINHQHIAVCEFLLKANADPFLADFTHCSAADNAWTKMFSGCLDSTAESAMRGMFTETECVERRNFTVIHKIVLGLLIRDLEQELQASTANINAQDSIGRTALSIAAERSHIDYVRILLTHGADPTITSYCGQTPLHYAATAKSSDCVELFMGMDLEVDCLTNWSQTPLHFAAAYTRTTKHTALLLAGGADPNKRDRDGMTPLSWTVVSNNIEAASILLNCGGIQVHDVDTHGLSTVHQCIQFNRHRILRLLVPHQPVVKNCFGRSELILNVIAAFADIETLSIIKDYDFSGITRYPDNCVDVPEYRILRDRSDMTPELLHAFQYFMVYVGILSNKLIDLGEGGDSIDDAEVFFDCAT